MYGLLHWLTKSPASEEAGYSKSPGPAQLLSPGSSDTGFFLRRCAALLSLFTNHFLGNHLRQRLLGNLAEWGQREILHDFQSLGKLELGDFLAEQEIFQLVETKPGVFAQQDARAHPLTEHGIGHGNARHV